MHHILLDTNRPIPPKAWPRLSYLYVGQNQLEHLLEFLPPILLNDIAVAHDNPVKVPQIDVFQSRRRGWLGKTIEQKGPHLAVWIQVPRKIRPASMGVEIRSKAELCAKLLQTLVQTQVEEQIGLEKRFRLLVKHHQLLVAVVGEIHKLKVVQDGLVLYSQGQKRRLAHNHVWLADDIVNWRCWTQIYAQRSDDFHLRERLLERRSGHRMLVVGNYKIRHQVLVFAREKRKCLVNFFAVRNCRPDDDSVAVVEKRHAGTEI